MEKIRLMKKSIQNVMVKSTLKRFGFIESIVT